jgi:sugar phosphate isomerase/epimerase
MTGPAVPLGVAHFSAISLAPVDFVRAAAAAGFQRVGLRLHPAFPGAPFYELPTGSPAARDVRAALDDHGVALHDIEFVVLSPDFRPDTLTAMLEGAAALGARRLSVCGDDPEEGRLVQTFGALCDLCAGVGMSVDLENMGWRSVATFDAALRVVEASGRANAGVLVDALHLFRNGGRAEDVARAPVGRIAALQLCDVQGAAPTQADAMVAEARGGRFAPGEGELPLADLVAAAPADAAISVEVPIADGRDVADHLANLARCARRVVDGNREP